MAVNSQEQIGDQSAQNLSHQTIGAAGDQVVDVEVLLPPPEEDFDVPAQLVSQGHIFGAQIKTVGGYIVIRAIDTVADDTDRLFRLVLALGTQKSHHIQEDMAAFRGRSLFDDGFSGALADPTDKVSSLGLPLVEVLMALVIAVHDAGLARGHNFLYKGPLVGFTGAEIDPLWNAPVQAESQMHLGLLDAVPVVGKLHRGDRVNQRAVHTDQVAQVPMQDRQKLFCLILQQMIHLAQLLKGSGVHRLEKGAAADPFGGSDMRPGKLILFEDLQQFTA